MVRSIVNYRKIMIVCNFSIVRVNERHVLLLHATLPSLSIRMKTMTMYVYFQAIIFKSWRTYVNVYYCLPISYCTCCLIVALHVSLNSLCQSISIVTLRVWLHLDLNPCLPQWLRLLFYTILHVLQSMLECCTVMRLEVWDCNNLPTP